MSVNNHTPQEKISRIQLKWLLLLIAVFISGSLFAWMLGARNAFPVWLLLLLTIGLAVATFIPGRVSGSPRPLLRRLLPSLILFLILFFVLAGVLLLHQHRKITGLKADQVQCRLLSAIENHAMGLDVMAHSVSIDARVKRGVRRTDRGQLFNDWNDLFNTLRSEHGLTHFNFITPGRIILLRMQQPELYGDKIDRFTTLEAERTGKSAWGLEGGSVGSLTLRVVRPVYDGSVLLGYVELGKEADEVIKAVYRQDSGIDLALLQHKNVLNRETWETGMRMLGREFDWDRMSHSVILYESHKHNLDVLSPFADDVLEGCQACGVREEEIEDNGKVWRFTALPFKDASGAEVGCFVVMNDITALKSDFNRDLIRGIAAGVILIAALLGMVFLMVRGTDVAISRQQANLRESKEKLAGILNNVKDVIWSATTIQMDAFLFISPSIGEIFGRMPEEFTKNPGIWFEAVYPEDRIVIENIISELERKGSSDKEYRVIDNYGVIHWVNYRSRVIYDEKGNVIRLDGILSDITERKKSEETLKLSERTYHEIFDGISDALFLHDIETGEILDVSESMLTKFGYMREDLPGLTVENLSALAEPYTNRYAGELIKRAAEGEIVVFEWLNRKKNGELFYSENILKSVLIAGTPRIMAIVRDISERKMAEEKISLLLAEKELLLKEVHHRIKNNMNTIKGLLTLQIHSEENPQIVSSLQSAENRVYSMIMLYDRLYSTNNYRELSVKEYLEPLTAEIIGSFPGNNNVIIETDIDDFILNVRLLSPLGIIANELLTNIMKYAFKGRDSGKILLTAKKHISRVIVVICDNGIGIPETVNFGSSTGFGLDLVKMLTDQIDGTIKIERNEGTRFILEFDV